MGNHRTAMGAKTLPGKYFSSQEVYDLETGNIFNKQWICVGRVDDLDSEGQYFLYESENESFIIVRGEGRKIRGFYNVCRHRGTRICDKSVGKFKQKIICPYHSWSYQLDGRLTVAANMKSVDGFEMADYPLHPVACFTWEGFIFINRSQSPIPFEFAYEPVFDRFKIWGIAGLKSVKKIEYEVKSNWKIIFQNFNECYHCPPVHPLLNKLTPLKSATNVLDSGPFLGGPMILNKSSQSMSMNGKRCGDVLPGLPEEEHRRVYYYSLFPSVCISPHPDYVLVHRIERKGIDRTKIICDLLFHPDSINKSGFDPTPAVELWDLTNRQDWNICELIHLGKLSEAYVPGPYSDLESILVAFDQYYLSQLEPQVK